jgi:uncharacterized protein involved in response to NO
VKQDCRPRYAQCAAYALFYPAATLYAAIILPASVLAMTGAVDYLRTLADPLVHAHEMLLGFALAVVAGNQLGIARGRFVVALLLLWACARGAFVLAPASLAAAALNAAFAGALAWRIVPRLFRTAKKWRNKALPAVIAGICAAAAAWQLARHAGDAGIPRALLLAVVLLFATLMLYMGGRIIAPAIAGQLHRQGRELQARVQPRIEAALLFCGAGAVVLVALPAARAVASAAAVSAGLLALVRMGRWRFWALRGRWDLLCLCAGYGWLGVGLIALGVAHAAQRHETAAIHLITVGALGTLTFTVMATLWSAHGRRTPASGAIALGTIAIATSTVFRLLGAFVAAPWLLASAACWSAAFGLLLAVFWRQRRRSR